MDLAILISENKCAGSLPSWQKSISKCGDRIHDEKVQYDLRKSLFICES